MNFSKTTGYGVRALTYLAGRGLNSVCALREIAEAEHIPPVYLRKVLAELRRHHLLHSSKGIGGGYELARRPQEITLWEVFELLEPEPDLSLCILGHGPGNPEAACPLRREWQPLRETMIRLLRSRTISDIAEARSREGYV